MSDVALLWEMRSRNGDHFRELDYIRYIFASEAFSEDLARSIDSVFSPNIIFRSDLALVQSVGADIVFDDLVGEGVLPSEAQKRANTFDVTEIFNCSYRTAKLIAAAISEGWKASLLDIGDCGSEVYVDEYENSGDVFIGLIKSE